MKDRRALRLSQWRLLELTVTFVPKMTPLTKAVVVVGLVIKRSVGSPIRRLVVIWLLLIKVGLRLLTITLVNRRIVTLQGANTVVRVGRGRSIVSDTLVKIVASAKAESQKNYSGKAHFEQPPDCLILM